MRQLPAPSNLPAPQPDAPLVLPSSDAEVDFRRVVVGMARRSWLTGLLIVVCLAAGLPFVLRTQATTYQAHTRVRVLALPDGLRAANLATSIFANADAQSLIQYITVEPAMERAGKALGVDAGDVRGAIELERQENASVVRISAVGPTSERAAEVANTFVDSFMEHHHGQLAKEIAEAVATLERQMAASRMRSKESQDALTLFVRSKGFEEPKEVETLSERIADVEAEVNAHEAELAAAQEGLKSAAERTDATPKYVNTPKSFRRKLQNGNSEVNAWTHKGGDARAPSGPSVVRNPIADTLAQTKIGLEALEVSSRAQLGKAQERLSKLQKLQKLLPSIQREYNALVVERDFALKSLTDSLVAVEGVRNLEHIHNPIYEVLERAEPPNHPLRSKRKLFIALLALVGLALGVATTLLLELRDTRIREWREIEAMGIPVIAAIPEAKKNQRGWRESMQQVAFWVRREAKRSPGACFLFSSAHMHEGKTEIVRTVGRILVEWGDLVLRVDANMREATGNPSRLESYLMGDSEHPTLTRYDDGLCAITSSGPRDDAPNLLASPWLDRLVAQARASFPVTLVDSPAVLPSVDAEMLAEKMDGVILIVRSNFTERAELAETINRLRGARRPVLGAILTYARTEKKSPKESS